MSALPVEQVLSARTPNEVFGAPPTGEDPEAWYKKQHRALSKVYHPDRNDHPQASQVQAKLNALHAQTEEVGSVDSLVRVVTKKATFAFSPPLHAVGDLSDVYKGRLDRPGKPERDVVIKVAHSPRDRDLFINEQRVLRALWKAIEEDDGLGFFGHTLPYPYGTFTVTTEDGDRPASSTKFFEGVTAEELVQTMRAVPPVQVAWMLTRLLTTIAAAHVQGYVHGAILPPHLIVRWSNVEGKRWAKVVGWTAAQKVGATPNLFFGKYRQFYPPEFFEKKPLTAATDVFMFGQVANYLFGGDTKNRLVPKNVPGPLRGVIRMCLLANPARRPHNAAELLLNDLRPALVQIWGAPKYIEFNPPAIPAG